MFSLRELIPVLQTAIGPVIVISGVGLLLLTMTNRLARTIDRIRELNQEASEKNSEQLSILWKRAQTVRKAIMLSGTSAFLAATMIIMIFLTAFFHLENMWFIRLISAVFIACMASLMGSLALFIHDVNQSLSALAIEIEHSS